MATRKDFAALIAGAVAQNKSPLFAFSAEILDLIIYHVFVSTDHIEFSPIERDEASMQECGLDASQYQHALNFQTRVRPTLAALRVCKAFYKLGIDAYYGQNEFRFSSYFGGHVLARFLELIGPDSTARLQSVTVAHPALWLPPRKAFDFYIRRLSPFGMADTAGYDKHWSIASPYNLASEPLKILCRDAQLTRLTFLVYGDAQEAGDWHMPQPEVFTYSATRILSRAVNFMAWGENVKVKLLNLYPAGPADPSGTPWLKLRLIDDDFTKADYPEQPRRLLPAETVSAARYAVRFPADTVHAALDVIQHVRAQGWSFEDASLCQHTGVYPVQEAQEGEVVDPSICEDEEGYRSREGFEAAWRKYLGEDGGVWYDGCVKCWRGFNKSDCIFEDGGAFLESGWTRPGVFIGNPGVPITVDPKVGNGKCGDVTWKESQSVKDFKTLLESEKPSDDLWWYVFSCDPYPRRRWEW